MGYSSKNNYPTGVIFIRQDSWASADYFGIKTIEKWSAKKLMYARLPLTLFGTLWWKNRVGPKTPPLGPFWNFRNFVSGAPIRIIFFRWKSRLPGLRLLQVRINNCYRFAIKLFAKTAKNQIDSRQERLKVLWHLLTCMNVAQQMVVAL